MKGPLVLLVLLRLAVVPLQGEEPPGSPRFPHDTRWVLHLDAERLLETRTADHVRHHLLHRQLEQFDLILGTAFGLDFALEEIRSITVCGTHLGPEPQRDALVMLRTNPGFQVNLRDMIDRQASDPGAPLPVRSLAGGIYAFENNLFLSVEEEGLFLLGPTREAVRRGRALYRQGEGVGVDGLPAWKAWSPLSGDTVFWMHLCGYRELARGTPRDWLVQLTRGFRITLREDREHLILEMQVQPRDDRTGKRVVRILRGALALAKLGAEDGFLGDWIRGTPPREPSGIAEQILFDALEEIPRKMKIGSTGERIEGTLLQMPVDRFIELLDARRRVPR